MTFRISTFLVIGVLAVLSLSQAFGLAIVMSSAAGGIAVSRALVAEFAHQLQDTGSSDLIPTDSSI